jgi:transcriptional regulator with XRE-family HTH domain
MDLKQIFVFNVKKVRKSRGMSQSKLAEACDTDISYIGQIEMGKRFPSMKLIEKIAWALRVEPYRLFMEESENGQDNLDGVDEFLIRLPDQLRKDMINRLNTAVNACIGQILSP